MKALISCAYNMDNCCVELKFTDGSMIAIDTNAVENEVADDMYQRSELGYLIYNAPLEYANLILNGDPETYLMSTEQTPVFFAAPKYPAMLSKLAKGRTESFGDSARGLTWQSHGRRFPAALQ